MKLIAIKVALVLVILLAALANADASNSGATNLPPPTDPVFDFAGYADELSFEPAAFGLVDNSILTFNPWGFQPYRGVDAPLLSSSGAQRYCTANCILEANVQLPSGANVTAIELDLYDNNASGSVSVNLASCAVGGFGCSTFVTVGSGNAEVPGSTQLMSVSNHTVLNGLNSYIAELFITGGTSETRVAGFRVFYKRQISPAPGVASFSDVPTNHPFFINVEALAASGITGGCGGGKYCPDNFVTRAQMAAFLSRALGLHWDGF